MKSKITNLLYIIIPIVFLLGVAIEFLLGYLPGTLWYPITTSWPLILLACLFIIFYIKKTKPYSTEIDAGEEFWKRWAGIFWIFWAFYIILAYFIPDPTKYFIDLGLKLPFTVFYFIVTFSLGLFIQFSSHRYFWRFCALLMFTLQGIMFLLDHWRF